MQYFYVDLKINAWILEGVTKTRTGANDLSVHQYQNYTVKWHQLK